MACVVGYWVGVARDGGCGWVLGGCGQGWWVWLGTRWVGFRLSGCALIRDWCLCVCMLVLHGIPIVMCIGCTYPCQEGYKTRYILQGRPVHE